MLSIKRRFIFTFGANFIRAGISFFTGMLLARMLGPELYGTMAFLLGIFIGMRQFLDMGSASAFFTFLSQENRSKLFVLWFFGWMALQFLMVTTAIWILFPESWVSAIWQGEERSLVLLAFIAVFFQHGMWPVIQQAGESQRRTIFIQIISVLIVCMHLLVMLVLYEFQEMGLRAIFIAIALEYGIGAYIAHRGFKYAACSGKKQKEKFVPMFKKYAHYCLPLILYSWIGCAYEITDRWLLQSYGGSIEQAYYAVGAQFASVSLIATTSILRIFWKEIAEAHHQKNDQRTGKLFLKINRLMYFLGATISGFLIPWAKELVELFLGTAYMAGSLTMIIMFLYPIHQSIGQIGGSMLYATEQVSTHVAIGIIFMLVSIVVTYFVLAPPTSLMPGLGLGSLGSALKMVILQFIQVNVLLLIICRLKKWKFDWWYQVVGLVSCVGIGYLAHFIFTPFLMTQLHLIFILLGAGLVYLILLAIFIIMFPWVAGITRNDLKFDFKKYLQVFNLK